MNTDMMALWIGVTSLVLAVPLTIIGNLISPRVVAYLEKRKLIKARKTRDQALRTYYRIQAFREGRRDRYSYYILLAGSAVLCAIASSTIIMGVLLISPGFDEPAMLSLLIALTLALFAVGFLAGLYETARQLERFDDYKKEFEDRWGPLSESNINQKP